MRIRHRYGISSFDKRVLRFLSRHKIAYQSDGLITSVEAFEDDERFGDIELYMRKMNAVDVKDAIYEKTELENSEWLTIKSEWWHQYPEPRDNMAYMSTTYDSTEYCKGTDNGYYCGKGLRQVHPFMMAKRPNWGARNFMMLNWVPDELFASLKACEILEDAGLLGFELWDVIDKKHISYENVKQVHIKTQLREGLDPRAVEQELVCPVCGFKKYIAKTGPIKLQKGLFDGLKCDVVRTTEKFGEIGCDSIILVSQKFYNVVKENRIDRGLVFEPVELT